MTDELNENLLEQVSGGAEESMEGQETTLNGTPSPTSPPALPATELSGNAYKNMFESAEIRRPGSTKKPGLTVPKS